MGPGPHSFALLVGGEAAGQPSRADMSQLGTLLELTEELSYTSGLGISRDAVTAMYEAAAVLMGLTSGNDASSSKNGWLLPSGDARLSSLCCGGGGGPLLGRKVTLLLDPMSSSKLPLLASKLLLLLSNVPEG